MFLCTSTPWTGPSSGVSNHRKIDSVTWLATHVTPCQLVRSCLCRAFVSIPVLQLERSPRRTDTEGREAHVTFSAVWRLSSLSLQCTVHPSPSLLIHRIARILLLVARVARSSVLCIRALSGVPWHPWLVVRRSYLPCLAPEWLSSRLKPNRLALPLLAR